MRTRAALTTALTRVVVIASGAILVLGGPPIARGASLTIASGDGLSLSVAANGSVAGIGIGGRSLALASTGGFSVRDVGGMPNLLSNGGFEIDANSDGVPDGWRRYGSGARPTLVSGGARTGARSIRISLPVLGDSAELRRDVAVTGDTLYTISGWLRTDAVRPTAPPAQTPDHVSPAAVVVREYIGAAASTMHFVYGYTETAAWHRRSLGFRTTPGTTKITVALRFKAGSGTVWYDQLRVARLLQEGTTPISGAVTAGAPGELRQSATGPGGLELEATYRASADRITVDGVVRSSAPEDRPLELRYTLPLDATGWSWHDHARLSRRIVAGQSYAYETRWNVQPMSRYPWNTVSDASSSLSIGVPLDMPRIERVRYGPEGLTLSFDLGLSQRATRLGPSATFRFVIFTSDPAWGYRAATEDYYRMFPEMFTRRIDPAREGGWGIRASFAERRDDFASFGLGLDMVPLGTDSGGGDLVDTTPLAEDDAQGVLSSAYNHHWGFKQPLADPGVIPAYQSAVASLEAQAAGPRTTVDERRRADRASAALRSTARDENDRLVYEGYLDLYLQWYEDLDPLSDGNDWATVTRVYQVDTAIDEAAAAGARLDGIHMDSTSGMRRWGAQDDYSSLHWAAALEPLTFSYDSGEVVKRTVFTDYGELERTADYARSRDLIVSANFNGSEARSGAWFGADLIDYFGIEQGLPDKVSTDPYVTVDSMALFKRSLAAQRPVSTIDARIADGTLTVAEVERRLQLDLFYGIYPGIGGSGRASDEALAHHARYAPLFRALGAAGWQPVTRARSTTASIWVERFGALEEGVQYLTVRNTGGSAAQASLAFDLPPTGWTRTDLAAHELVSDAPVAVTVGTNGRRAALTVPLGAGSTALIRITGTANLQTGIATP